MPLDTFRVTATSLNLRSAPTKSPENILAVLSQGQTVERLAGARGAEFWRVRTNLNGLDVDGHVAAEFLTPVLDTPAAGALPAAHLAEDRPSVKRDAPPNAFPIGESDRPSCPPKSLAEIADWLDVEHSRRYRPVPDGPTFCNVYAHDYCYLANVYLPRVWWNPAALADLLAEKKVSATTRTVHELRANDIFNWLDQFGTSFGWQREVDATALQDAANDGEVCLIIAQRRELERPGHVTMVVAETDDHRATRERNSCHSAAPDAGRPAELPPRDEPVLDGLRIPPVCVLAARGRMTGAGRANFYRYL